MSSTNRIRVLVGFVAAWAVSIGVAFVAGCAIALSIGGGYSIEVLNAMTTAGTDASGALLFAGGIAAAIAAPAATLATVFIAWPLYLSSRGASGIPLRAYILAGITIALVVAAILMTWQYYFYPLPAASIYWFELLTIILCGLAYSLVFWGITTRTSSQQI